MTAPNRFNLRNTLAEIYPDEASMRRLLADAGINAGRITLTSSAINNWHLILTEAEKSHKSTALLDVALAEYGDNPHLRAAVTAYQPSTQPEPPTLLSNSAPVTPPPTIAPNEPIDIFLSYSRNDTAAMQRLRAELQAASFSVWIDDLDLEPGTPSWQRAVETAIHAARCMVVILSPAAKASVWVGRELSYAETLGLRIFPVLVSGDPTSAVPIGLINHQRVDLRGDWQPGLDRLLLTLRRQLGVEPPLSNPLVQPPHPNPPLVREGTVKGSIRGPLLSGQQPLASAHEEQARPQSKPSPTDQRLPPSAGEGGSGGKSPSAPVRSTWRNWIWLNVIIGALLLFLGYTIFNYPSRPAPASPAPGGNALTPSATAPGERGVAPPTNPVTLTTWTDPKYDLTFVYVPAGSFLMGSTEAQIEDALQVCLQYNKDCKREWFANEAPQRTVTLNAFWIMQTEVSNAQYQKCVAAGDCTKPNNDTWDKPENAQYPVTDVDWQQANVYAIWAGGQLPTEAQWEKAARGTNGRIYPWSDEWQSSLVNYCDKNCTYDWKDGVGDDGYAQTAPVDSYPDGASPYGARNMAGNVWEWTSTAWGGCEIKASFGYPYDPDDGREKADDTGCRVLRGGSWNNLRDNVRAGYRVGYAPANESGILGFRVVRMSSPGF